MFHVGQKVVCIETWVRREGYGDEVGPVAGKVYTIRALLDEDVWGDLGLHLEEIVNPVRNYFGGPLEPGFARRRFRPVKTTNIDVFLNMLAPTPSEVEHA